MLTNLVNLTKLNQTAYTAERSEQMKWDRSETIGLAKAHCVLCKGKGLKRNVNKRAPCNCVLRAIFRACYARFRRCMEQEKFMSTASLVPCQGKDQNRSYSRLDEEYIADF